jgi:hypothetical protein
MAYQSVRFGISVDPKECPTKDDSQWELPYFKIFYNISRCLGVEFQVRAPFKV